MPRVLREWGVLTKVAVVGVVAVLAVFAPAATAHAGPAWPVLKEWKTQGGGAKDAVLIAVVEKYAYVPGVAGAAANGEAWFRYLRKSRGVPRDHVTLLRNEEVTAESLLEKAQEAATSVGEGGTLWFVFVGHGAASADGKEGVLIAADAQQTEKGLYGRSVAQSALLAKLAASRAGRIVAVLDSCFSGRSPTGEALGKGLQPLVFKRQADDLDPRVVLLTAARNDEFAGALPGLDRPAFSYLVLGGLRGWARDDGQGEVTGAALQSYAQSALRSVLPAGRKQTPTVAGAATASLGQGWEKGPDLDAMVIEGSKLIVPEGPKLELSKVPELGGTLRGGVVLGADVEALVAYDNAVKAQRRADGEAKAAAWKALAAVGGNNPYKADAERQAAAWAGHVEQRAVLEKSASIEFNKLRQLMSLSVVSEKQKKMLVIDFKARFGMLASWAAKAAELSGRGETVSIPGGTFTMGDRKDAVTVASFEIDRTGVTVAAYKACVEAGRCPAGHRTGYWSNQEQSTPYCNWGKTGRDNHPMNCVDWDAAKTYCEAQGKRLPTEEQREWVARGGDEGRTYPWGNEVPAGQLCWNGEGNDLGKGQRKSTCPVSSYPAGHSKHGVHDLAGNMSEWTASAWASGSPQQVLRGGSWGVEAPALMRAADRSWIVPMARGHYLGFRCARSAP